MKPKYRVIKTPDGDFMSQKRIWRFWITHDRNNATFEMAEKWLQYWIAPKRQIEVLAHYNRRGEKLLVSQ